MRNTGKESITIPEQSFNDSRLRFVKSSFGGQLPQYFHPNGTSFNAPNFNDLNKEEPTRYVSTPGDYSNTISLFGRLKFKFVKF
jgi:hypothetical protein